MKFNRNRLFFHEKLFAMVLVLLISYNSQAQILINGNQTATVLAQSLVGPGVSISNPTINCPGVANGEFFVTPPNVSNLGIDSGIVLTSGVAQTNGFTQGANGPAQGPANVNSTPGDPDLALLCAKTTFDACILEFDFIPLGDSVKFDYVFGSSEYPSFTCTQFNDVFGFFISGPGITGPYTGNSKNIALVPGSTTCPVGVSTIYCPNLIGCCNTTNTNCFNLTNGCAAFNAANNTCAYFVCNANGASVNYQGFTTVLTAETAVTPCSTHHLKLAISDAADGTLDSGVFLKAGSLTSNSVTFQPLSALNAPQPYVVEGCAAGLIKISRAAPTPNAFTIAYGIGGSAINGVDYNTLSGSATIPANDTVTYINITGIGDNIAEGQESLILYQYAPCTTNIIDSVEILISDNYIASIATNDTTVCAEDSVFIQVNGDDSLTYTWTPVVGINNSTIKEPTVSPNLTTSYIASITYPQAGCPILYDTITITIKQQPNVNIGSDRIICENAVINFNPIISPTQNYNYTWTGNGTAFLSSTTIANPVGTFTQQGIYNLYLNVDPAAVGCEGFDTIRIEVIPDDITMVTPDTIICKGGQVPIRVNGHPYFNYNWTPSLYLNNATIEDPISTPDTSIIYTVTATYPGCTPMTKVLEIEVEPVPTIDAGPDRAMCDFDTLNLHVDVVPGSYPNYSYAWTPASGFLIGDTTADPVFIGRTAVQLQVIVSTPIGCSDTDNVFINVNSVEFNTTTPEEYTLCPNDSLQYNSIGGGVSYVWEPNLYLSSNLVPNPWAKPIVPLEYTIYATSAQGCVDTDKVEIRIAPQTVIDAGDDVTIYPGESHQIFTQGNGSYFNWFPPYALNSSTVSDPIATPGVSTLYFVTARTEQGCESQDSIYVRVSEETLLDLPNAFTPGTGTSINDFLTIKKRGIATLNYFKIYNRWGELIWETKNIDEGWNGMFNGIPQPLGAYVFIIEAKTSTGKIFNKQGTVTLIR